MKIRPIFKTIDIFSFIQFLSRQTNYIIKFFLLKVLYLVYYWRRLKLGLPAHRDASHKRLRDYTVYDRHGNVAAFGTARECARALGVKVETIYRLASRSARCRDGRVVREPDS